MWAIRPRPVERAAASIAAAGAMQSCAILLRSVHPWGPARPSKRPSQVVTWLLCANAADRCHERLGGTTGNPCATVTTIAAFCIARGYAYTVLTFTTGRVRVAPCWHEGERSTLRSTLPAKPPPPELIALGHQSAARRPPPTTAARPGRSTLGVQLGSPDPLLAALQRRGLPRAQPASPVSQPSANMCSTNGCCVVVGAANVEPAEPLDELRRRLGLGAAGAALDAPPPGSTPPPVPRPKAAALTPTPSAPRTLTPTPSAPDPQAHHRPSAGSGAAPTARWQSASDAGAAARPGGGAPAARPSAGFSAGGGSEGRGTGASGGGSARGGKGGGSARGGKGGGSAGACSGSASMRWASAASHAAGWL